MLVDKLYQNKINTHVKPVMIKGDDDLITVQSIAYKKIRATRRKRLVAQLSRKLSVESVQLRKNAENNATEQNNK